MRISRAARLAVWHAPGYQAPEAYYHGWRRPSLQFYKDVFCLSTSHWLDFPEFSLVYLRNHEMCSTPQLPHAGTRGVCISLESHQFTANCIHIGRTHITEGKRRPRFGRQSGKAFEGKVISVK